MRFVHYGSDSFDLSIWHPVVDGHWIKPKHGTGLWGSPVTSEFGWREWCQAEDWKCDFSKSFEFEVEGNILTIDSVSDLEQLSWGDFGGNHHFLMFEVMAACGVDAIYLTDRGQVETRHSTPFNLYGWDCESVLVLRRECLRFPVNAYCESRHAESA